MSKLGKILGTVLFGVLGLGLIASAALIFIVPSSNDLATPSRGVAMPKTIERYKVQILVKDYVPFVKRRSYSKDCIITDKKNGEQFSFPDYYEALISPTVKVDYNRGYICTLVETKENVECVWRLTLARSTKFSGCRAFVVQKM